MSFSEPTDRSSDLAAEIAAAWAAAGESAECSPLDVVDLDEFLQTHHSEQESIARAQLEPWLSVSAQTIIWLSHLHISLTDDVGLSARHRSTWALTGLASANATAVRRLVLAGLDTPARAVLRNMIESLAICVVCLDDTTLAESYVAAQDEESARRLWRRELSGDAMRRRFTRAWRTDGTDAEEAIEAFMIWLDEEKGCYSQAVHSSYIAGAITSLAPGFESETLEHAFLGSATSASKRTLGTLAQALWFFSRIVSRQILGLNGRDSRLRNFDRTNHFDRIVIAGFYAIGTLVSRYWNADDEAPAG